MRGFPIILPLLVLEWVWVANGSGSDPQPEPNKLKLNGYGLLGLNLVNGFG